MAAVACSNAGGAPVCAQEQVAREKHRAKQDFKSRRYAVGWKEFHNQQELFIRLIRNSKPSTGQMAKAGLSSSLWVVETLARASELEAQCCLDVPGRVDHAVAAAAGDPEVSIARPPVDAAENMPVKGVRYIEFEENISCLHVSSFV